MVVVVLDLLCVFGECCCLVVGRGTTCCTSGEIDFCTEVSHCEVSVTLGGECSVRSKVCVGDDTVSAEGASVSSACDIVLDVISALGC